MHLFSAPSSSTPQFLRFLAKMANSGEIELAGILVGISGTTMLIVGVGEAMMMVVVVRA